MSVCVCVCVCVCFHDPFFFHFSLLSNRSNRSLPNFLFFFLLKFLMILVSLCLRFLHLF